MNIRITRSLVLAIAIAVTIFAGGVSHSAAQVACDPYGCYYPDGSLAYPVDPGYGLGCDPIIGCVNVVSPPIYGTGCDPMLGCSYPDPGYGLGCDPIIGCVNVVSPPIYGTGCDPVLGCY